MNYRDQNFPVDPCNRRPRHFFFPRFFCPTVLAFDWVVRNMYWGILKFYCWLGELRRASQRVVPDIILFFVILLYEVKFCTADQCQLARVLLCLCFSSRRETPCWKTK